MLVLLLMVISIPAFSQFKVKTGVGTSVQFQTDKINIFQSSITVTPQQTIDVGNGLTIGAQVQTFISDSLTVPYVGTKVSYPVWIDKEQSKSFNVAGLYEIGPEGRQMIGGGVSYGAGDIDLALDLAQEYKSKTFWLGLHLFYTIVK